MNSRPLIALSLGDPAGVGPEVTALALSDPRISDALRVLVVGDARALARAVELQRLDLAVNQVGKPGQAAFQPGTIDILPTAQAPDHCFGRTTPECGESAFQAVVKAVELVQTGQAEAICTAPLAKASMQAAGHIYPGHTELLAELTGAAEPVMLLAGSRLKVSLVTAHAGLRQIFDLITPERIVRTAKLTDRFLSDLGSSRRRIAICGLNPHAGEDGLFGREDQEIIAPAVEAARAQGIDLIGPEPPDTVFHRAFEGEFDAVVALYHDQGLIPLKLAHFREAVNVTLGLPIVRTSVGHGTAFDKAGQGIADPYSLKMALKCAAALARPGEERIVW